ncbi:MAG TPA: hypothetical protein VHS96_17455 [Bacteroidia bacterium]|nr:hypothetical protein [Bacteroidia bacterium]
MIKLIKLSTDETKINPRNTQKMKGGSAVGWFLTSDNTAPMIPKKPMMARTSGPKAMIPKSVLLLDSIV